MEGNDFNINTYQDLLEATLYFLESTIDDNRSNNRSKFDIPKR